MGKAVLLVILFVFLALIGCYSVLTGLRKIRAPRIYNGALMSWSEHAGRDFRYDFPTWLAIMIHRLALVLISAIAVLSVMLRSPEGLPMIGWYGVDVWYFEPLMYMAMCLLGFAAGYSLFGPIAELLAGDHHYAVSQEGILLADQLIPWSAFRDFELNPQRNLVYLWSASMPAALGMLTAPVQAGDAEKLASILGAHLPVSQRSTTEGPQRYLFPALIALACAPFVATATVMLLVPSMLAVMVDALLQWVLVGLGGILITGLIYGGKTRKA